MKLIHLSPTALGYRVYLHGRLIGHVFQKWERWTCVCHFVHSRMIEEQPALLGHAVRLILRLARRFRGEIDQLPREDDAPPTLRDENAQRGSLPT